MKRIKNLVTSPTEYTENAKWVVVSAFRLRLLQTTDWITQFGSGIIKKSKWFEWRNRVRGCTRSKFDTPEKMQEALEVLELSAPSLEKNQYSTDNIDNLKHKVISTIRYYFSKKLECQLFSYLNSPALIDERFKEVEIYKKTNNLDSCYFIHSFMEITGKSVEDVVEYFTKQKELHFSLLFRTQNELEAQIKKVDNITEIGELLSIKEEYDIWISILTLTPVQI